MSWWNNIYSHFNPIAFEIFSLKVHWYGIMYVLALLTALTVAKYFLQKDDYGISKEILDNYFIWVEIGVILGARLGYVLIYSGEASYYILHPWNIFNPYRNGEFVGISGMSYHGAVIGFIIASFWYCKKYSVNSWKLLDLVALSVPLGYFFGRIGNFLNQELVGRVTDVPWGIFVNGILRHPSQIYEAILEGIVIFIVLYFYRKNKKFDGELISLYVILYSFMRFVCEFFRQPDANLGFIFFGISMGQLLSIFMFLIGLNLFFILKRRNLLKTSD